MTDPLNAALQAITDSLPNFDDATYAAWCAGPGALSKADRESLAVRLKGADSLPKISILIGYQGEGSRLRATFASLDIQLYHNFCVIVACQGHQQDDLQKLARQYPNLDIGINAIDGFDPDIWTLENVALGAASTEFIGFLAEGDRLAPEAVAEILLTLKRLPETVILYTDEDWADPAGRRCRPRFKAAWDPDAQLGYDLMGRFSPMRRSAALAVGGLTTELETAAHYRLHCRVAELAGPARIVHLASVLRHAGRVVDPSPAAAETYSRYARGVAEGSARRAEGVQVAASPAPLAPWLSRIAWPMPNPAPLVSIIMPTRDRADLLRAACQGVLMGTDYPELELLILDNGSIEPETGALFQELQRDARVRVLNCPGPFNYSKLNNDGVAQAQGEIIVLLNNDVEIIRPDWLREMVSLAVRPEVGCVGAKLLYGDRRIQHAGVSLAPYTGCAHVGRLQARDDPGYDGSLSITRTYSAVTAACLAIRKSVFTEVGGLDAEALKVGYNDVDLCLKVGDHGYRVVLTPFAELFHMESVSRGPNDNPIKAARERSEQARIVGRWRELFLDDPYQNPNLLLTWSEAPVLGATRRPRGWASPNAQLS